MLDDDFGEFMEMVEREETERNRDIGLVDPAESSKMIYTENCPYKQNHFTSEHIY